MRTRDKALRKPKWCGCCGCAGCLTPRSYGHLPVTRKSRSIRSVEEPSPDDVSPPLNKRQRVEECDDDVPPQLEIQVPFPTSSEVHSSLYVRNESSDAVEKCPVLDPAEENLGPEPLPSGSSIIDSERVARVGNEASGRSEDADGDVSVEAEPEDQSIAPDPFTSQCPHCGDRFSNRLKKDRHKFEQHKKMHYGLLPYPCPFCSTGFVSPLSLLTHMSLHEKIGRYECPNQPQCAQKFPSGRALDEHRRSCKLGTLTATQEEQEQDSTQEEQDSTQEYCESAPFDY